MKNIKSFFKMLLVSFLIASINFSCISATSVQMYFEIEQELLYPEKTDITIFTMSSLRETVLEIYVNDELVSTKDLPEGHGPLTFTVDLSKYQAGDVVEFRRVYVGTALSDMPFLTQAMTYNLKKKTIKTPKKTAIKKIKKLGKSKVKVILKKVKNVSGYKVSCSTNKKFKGKGTKVKTAKTNTVVIKGLKAGKYFVKAQTYNALKGSKTKYSKASKLKKVKVS